MMNVHVHTHARTHTRTRTQTHHYSHVDGFVPVNDVTGHGKGLNVYDVDVASLRSYVQPLALERQVTVGQPETINNRSH